MWSWKATTSKRLLKALYSSFLFTLIYPYLNYAVVVWGNTYPSNLNKLCTLQNKCIRCMFFADSRESSQVFYKLLDILKFDNIVKLSTCVLAHKIFNKSSNIPSLFHGSLRTVSSLHKYNTRYASKGNFHRPNVRTNTGKFTFVYAASKLWETVPDQQTWYGSLLKTLKSNIKIIFSNVSHSSKFPT